MFATTVFVSSGVVSTLSTCAALVIWKSQLSVTVTWNTTVYDWPPMSVMPEQVIIPATAVQ